MSEVEVTCVFPVSDEGGQGGHGHGRGTATGSSSSRSSSGAERVVGACGVDRLALRSAVLHPIQRPLFQNNPGKPVPER